MKNIALLVVLAFCLCALPIPSGAADVSQGEFALVLAQLLGLEAVTQEEAVDSLSALEIKPLKGWEPNELMTGAVTKEIEEAVKKAVRSGLLDPEIAEGAVEAAAVSTKVEIEEAGGPPGTPPVEVTAEPSEADTRIVEEGTRDISPFRPQ